MKLLVYCITLFLCLCSLGLKAQPKPLPDSIRVEFPEYQSIITFELRQYAVNKSLIKNFPVQLTDLLKHILSSITEAERDKPRHIAFVYATDDDNVERNTLVIREVTPETKATIVQDAIIELLPPGWEITIKMKEAEIHVYAPSLTRLTELTQLNLDPVIHHLESDPETYRQKRMGIISRIIFREGNVQTAKTSHRYPNDMLGLHAGAGVGIVRDQFYPEFNFTTSFYFANRYKENHQRISAHYELKLFTGRSLEGEYRSWPSSFVSVSYAMNFQKDRPRWTGLGAGFMVNNRSDLFTGKTMKIFIESDIGNPKLNIIPELYLTDGFKQALFGIKLNYKF